MKIPISLIIYALKKKKVNQLKLYLYLKANSSGHLKLDEVLRAKACADMGWKDKRTYTSKIEWLLKHHWVTLNNNTHSLRLVSLEQVHRQINGCVYTGTRMDSTDLTQFRPFIYASVITWATSAKRKSLYMSERKKGHSRKSIKYLLHSDLPNRYLSKILELDQSCITRYKHEAEAAGYIRIKHRIQELDLDISHLPTIQKYADTDIVNSIFMMNDKLYTRKSDIISPRIKLCYLKRLRGSP